VTALAFRGPADDGQERYWNRNAVMVAAAARRHIPDGALVADVTFGAGRFWREVVNGMWFDLAASDIAPRPSWCRRVLTADLRALPYRDGVFDAVVLDPPYLSAWHDGLHAGRAYNGGLPVLGYSDVVGLFRQGITEAARVTRPDGQLWLKCQNRKGRGEPDYRVTLPALAAPHGFALADLLTLSRKSKVGGRNDRVTVKDSFLLVLYR
jgi:hypothetical protein